MSKRGWPIPNGWNEPIEANTANKMRAGRQATKSLYIWRHSSMITALYSPGCTKLYLRTMYSVCAPIAIWAQFYVVEFEHDISREIKKVAGSQKG